LFCLFCWKFSDLFSRDRNLKSDKNRQSYRHEFGVLVIWDIVYMHPPGDGYDDDDDAVNDDKCKKLR